MPLYHVQDDNAPKWVLAANYANAIEKWKKAVAAENEPYEPGEIEEPKGIVFVCDDDDLVIADSMRWPKE